MKSIFLVGAKNDIRRNDLSRQSGQFFLSVFPICLIRLKEEA